MTAPPTLDKTAVLAANPLFAGIDRQDLDPLAKAARVLTVANGQPIFAKGDAGDSMMAVLEGRVRIVCWSEEGKELTLNIIAPGEFFGEIALLDGEPPDRRMRSRWSVAACWWWTATPSGPGWKAGRRWRWRCWRCCAGGCGGPARNSRIRCSSEAPFRLARGLLRLADSFGQAPGDGTRIGPQAVAAEPGTLVSLSRESVNKCLKEWEREGLLALTAGRIVLRDGPASRPWPASTTKPGTKPEPAYPARSSTTPAIEPIRTCKVLDLGGCAIRSISPPACSRSRRLRATAARAGRGQPVALGFGSVSSGRFRPEAAAHSGRQVRGPPLGLGPAEAPPLRASARAASLRFVSRAPPAPPAVPRPCASYRRRSGL